MSGRFHAGSLDLWVFHFVVLPPYQCSFREIILVFNKLYQFTQCRVIIGLSKYDFHIACSRLIFWAFSVCKILLLLFKRLWKVVCYVFKFSLLVMNRKVLKRCLSWKMVTSCLSASPILHSLLFWHEGSGYDYTSLWCWRNS